MEILIFLQIQINGVTIKIYKKFSEFLDVWFLTWPLVAADQVTPRGEEAPDTHDSIMVQDGGTDGAHRRHQHRWRTSRKIVTATGVGLRVHLRVHPRVYLKVHFRIHARVRPRVHRTRHYLDCPSSPGTLGRQDHYCDCPSSPRALNQPLR